MIPKLFSIVSFIAVPAGATVSMPHGLEEPSGESLIPDELKRRTTGIFTVTADDTNVTVTNEGSEADIDVLCEHWHSLERQLGAGVDELSIQPWETEGDGLSGGGEVVFQWSPDAPDDKLVPGRIFASFLETFKACVAARELGFTKVSFHFDRSYSLTLDVNGNKTSRVPTSAIDGTLVVAGSGLPAGTRVWDFAGIMIDGGWSFPGGIPSTQGVNISFDDGAIIQPTADDIKLTFALGVIHNDQAGHIPIRPAPNWGLYIIGGPQVVLEADAGALPLLALDPNAFFWYFASGQNGNGGIGPFEAASPAPVLDIMGRFTVLGFEGIDNWLCDNVLTDSVGGGLIDERGPCRQGRGNDLPGTQPGIGESGAVGSAGWRNQQRFNLKIPVMLNQFSPGAPITVDGTVLTPGVNYVDTAGGDVTVKMPFANPTSGQNIWIIVLGAGKVIVTPFGANVRNVGGVVDTIDTPDVLTATKGLFVANGGMDGSGIGRWERFI